MSRANGTFITILLTGALVALIGVQVSDWLRTKAPAATGVPAPTKPPRLTIGATTAALARNAAVAWTPADLAEVDAFERAAGSHAGIVMWFADFAGTGFRAEQARAVAARGALPEISWEPWDASNPSADQPRYRLRTIVRGDHDGIIREWARRIGIYGAPIRLRFAHEMNGRWYPWAERANDNRPGEFVAAWRHVRQIFAEEGTTNVTWIWSPVAGTVTEALFPGEDEVDVVAVSGFNGGTALYRRRWRPFETAFGPTLTAVHAMAPSKPVALSEIASADVGGSKAQWITDMFAALEDRPYVRSLVWFNLEKETDWRITSSEPSRAAFEAGAAAR